MLRLTMVIGLVVILCGSVFADSESDFVSRSNQIIERQAEAFQQGFSLMRHGNRFPAGNVELSQLIFQYYFEDNGEEWVNDEKLDYTYNESGLLEYVYYSYWEDNDDYRDEWSDPFHKEHLVWTPEGLIESLTSYVMGETEEGFDWQPIVKWTCEYNALGNIEKTAMYFYNPAADQFIRQGLIEFFYDDNDMVEYFMFSYYMPRSRSERERVKLYYDGHGRVIEAIDEYEEDPDYWVYEYKSIMEYHENDNTSYEDIQNFFNLFPMSMAIGWYQSAHPIGDIESETFYDWYYDYENETGEWYAYGREKLFYDENNLAYRIEFQDYDEDSDDWITSGRTLFTYNEHQRIEEALDQWYDFNVDAWVDDFRVLGYYEDITSVEDYYLPAETTALTNYPNPFNPETNISFSLAHDQKISLNIYNVKGQKVRNLYNGHIPAGSHQIRWDGRDRAGNHLGSGVYFYRLETERSSHVRRMLMLK